MKTILIFVLALIAVTMAAPQRDLNNPDPYFYQPSYPGGFYRPPVGGEPISIGPTFVNPPYPGQPGGYEPISIGPTFVNPPYPGQYGNYPDRNYDNPLLRSNNK